jgi:hypothetical protein
MLPWFEAFEFHPSGAFRKEWIAVDRAVRLACKLIGVSNFGRQTVPNPAACQCKKNQLWPSPVAIFRFPRPVAFAERTLLGRR